VGILIGCEHVSHEWPGKRVLADQTIGINEGDRIGIVGRNGDGKSTLVSLISHQLEPDSGQVVWRNGITVGTLAQTDSLADDDTVRHAVVGDTPEYLWASDPRIRGILDELIGDLDWEGVVGELSGGQRRRCDLARLLMGTWDVICMDEPTNHLDMHAIRWLAGHLKNRWVDGRGALLVVTHDRWFLDEVCDHMWEVHDTCVDPFEGGYSAYVQQRVERDRQAQVIEERRQNTLRKELNWLSHGAQARSSKPKFRIDAAMTLLANDPPLRKPHRAQAHGGEQARQAGDRDEGRLVLLSGKPGEGHRRRYVDRGSGRPLWHPRRKRRREVHAPLAHVRKATAHIRHDQDRQVGTLWVDVTEPRRPRREGRLARARGSRPL